MIVGIVGMTHSSDPKIELRAHMVFNRLSQREGVQFVTTLDDGIADIIGRLAQRTKMPLQYAPTLDDVLEVADNVIIIHDGTERKWRLFAMRCLAKGMTVDYRTFYTTDRSDELWSISK